MMVTRAVHIQHPDHFAALPREMQRPVFHCRVPPAHIEDDVIATFADRVWGRSADDASPRGFDGDLAFAGMPPRLGAAIPLSHQALNAPLVGFAGHRRLPLTPGD